MPNPRLASRYAKSLIDLALEENQLEIVFADMQYLQALCAKSRDFLNFIQSPIIKAEKKVTIVNAVTKDKVGKLVAGFNKLLITKGREANLPEIIEAFINQYFLLKGFKKVKLTTAVPIGDDIRQTIIAKVNEAVAGTIELATKTNENLIGGFVLEFDNKLIDASVQHYLTAVKNQFNRNYYINKIINK
jgi:F-type H+-transporting ATPase subunit delta